MNLEPKIILHSCHPHSNIYIPTIYTNVEIFHQHGQVITSRDLNNFVKNGMYINYLMYSTMNKMFSLKSYTIKHFMFQPFAR